MWVKLEPQQMFPEDLAVGVGKRRMSRGFVELEA